MAEKTANSKTAANPKPFNVNKIMLPGILGVVSIVVIIVILTSALNIISPANDNSLVTGGAIVQSISLTPLKNVVDNIGSYISFHNSALVELTISGKITDYALRSVTVVDNQGFTINQNDVFTGKLTDGLYSIELRGCFTDTNVDPQKVYSITGFIIPKTRTSTNCLCEHRLPGETTFKSTGLTFEGKPFYPYISIYSCYSKNDNSEGITFRCSPTYSYSYNNFFLECNNHS